MDALFSSKTSVNIYQTTRRRITDDNNIQGNKFSVPQMAVNLIDQLSDDQL
jgi:hypothetical protein